jgi:ketosteroid isomerase-like protein
VAFVAIAHVQSDPAQTIRARVAQIDKSATGIPSSDTEADAVIWTGAYARPIVGATKPDPKDFVAAPNRRNIQTKTTIERIVVSQDRTMAYEYSTFTLTSDDDGGHQTRNGAALRVWRNTGTDWKVSANFQRPYGRVQTTW